ncbi:hypothetical protein TL16_g11849 [Triparma laevis f. inornata]|uniref:HSF-type DNA-binding domain-containing protein n=1 Tax=Triparma laevis f. inornata TaxID=1714386 RepID=A0A9W7EUV4_9STRA|nr:hypothetical protein TL16_g11849 [Triparma laevis f. inornata]
MAGVIGNLPNLQRVEGGNAKGHRKKPAVSDRSRSSSPRPASMSRQSSTGSNHSTGSRSGSVRQRSKSRSPKREGSATPPQRRVDGLHAFAGGGGPAKPGPKLREGSWAPPSKGLDKNTFPAKVHEILRLEDPSVVSWNLPGISFAVRNRERFINEVLPLYFRHNNITSFFRQLNLYNFQRSVKGADVGSYQHDLFLRDRPELIKLMKRTKTKGALSPRCDGSMSRNSPFGSRSPSVGHSSSMTPPGVAGHAFAQMYHHQQQQMNMTLPSKPLVVNSGGMNPNYVMSSSSDPAVVEKRLEQIDTVVNMVGGGGFGVGSGAINVNVNNPISASAGADIKAEGAVNVNNANNTNGGVEALAPP